MAESKSNFDNYIVEFLAGLIFAIFPILIGIYFGRKIKDYEFHNNVDGVLTTLIKLREKKLIEPLVIRQVVKSVATNFGNEALKEDLAEKAYKKYLAGGNKLGEQCKVCNLISEIEGRKCKICKINCYAWDLSSVTKEEIEIAEIEKIIKKI
ncbi:MAG: hypothetical protein WBP41_02365 [Saprospiraceae bacterium]